MQKQSSIQGYYQNWLVNTTHLPTPCSHQSVDRSKLQDTAQQALTPVPDSNNTTQSDVSDDFEDKTKYCYCKKEAYGKLIGCDNQNYKYQRWSSVAHNGAVYFLCIEMLNMDYIIHCECYDNKNITSGLVTSTRKCFPSKILYW